ncbi:MAG: hypothetical protein K2X82_00970, partial [Gemmataceae bacterium]|nr:hypothetical protein [Gemmataceae bacterium]
SPPASSASASSTTVSCSRVGFVRACKAKYDALVADKVPQKLVGETPGGRTKIEYHYEGLDPNGPHINIGVPEYQLPGFNDAVIGVRILPPKK